MGSDADQADGFGERLYAARTRRKLSQDALAACCGLNKGDISAYENGHHEPSVRTLSKLADALDMSADDLLGRARRPRTRRRKAS